MTHPTLRWMPGAVMAMAMALALALASCAVGADAVGPNAVGPGATDPAAGGRPFVVKIIGLNDFHGNVQSPGAFGRNAGVPVAQRPAVGGADALGALVARLKAGNPHNVVVGAGDFIGASPLISALFHDEPAVEALNRIGLEFSAVGNHEFDKGGDSLLRLQRGGCRLVGGAIDPTSCQGAAVGTPVPFEGAKFQWLSANVQSAATGQTLLPPFGIKRFNGVPIAFIGMTLEGTPGIVTPTGVAGLSFRNEADTVNALVPVLRQRGVNAIVVLLHQGGVQSGGLADLNGCDGDLKGSEVAAIVSKLDDAVDLVVSGHTHAAYNCSANTLDVTMSNGVATETPRPTGVPNARGRRVPVTSASAFGRVLSDIDVTLDPATGRITAVSPVNRLVDRGDPETQAAMVARPELTKLVAAYGARVAPLANQVVGSITATLTSAIDAAGNMSAGELIADSQLAATASPDLGNAVIALMNPGGVRGSGFLFASSAAGEGDGNVTYGEAFAVQPFGNSLVTLTLTAQDLKNVLEQQFAGCRGQTSQRVLIPSAGLRYRWQASGACDRRVTDLRLVDAGGNVVDTIVDGQGTVLQPGRTYRVTVNNYLATGGDGFTSLSAGTRALGGAQDIDALATYLGRFKGPGLAAYDPAAPALRKPRITRVP